MWEFARENPYPFTLLALVVIVIGACVIDSIFGKK